MQRGGAGGQGPRGQLDDVRVDLVTRRVQEVRRSACDAEGELRLADIPHEEAALQVRADDGPAGEVGEHAPQAVEGRTVVGRVGVVEGVLGRVGRVRVQVEHAQAAGVVGRVEQAVLRVAVVGDRQVAVGERGHIGGVVRVGHIDHIDRAGEGAVLVQLVAHVEVLAVLAEPALVAVGAVGPIDLADDRGVGLVGDIDDRQASVP